MKKIRIHKQLNRSHFGNFMILFMLVAVGIFMGLPLYYNIIQSIKPVKVTEESKDEENTDNE